jgi:uncharacterized protein YqhQ
MKEKKSRKKKEHKMSLAFGGQAVLEGVLMRSKNYTVVCVRKEDGSTQKVTEKLNPRSARHRILRAPFIRGIYALLQTMYIGVKALYVSANISLEKEGEKIKPSEMAIAVIIAMLMGIGLFAVLPYFTTHWLNLKGLVFNVIEGIIRLVIFILYLLESGGGPIDEKTKGHKRFHPRCGTSFILIVLLISIIIFSLMPDLGWLINFSYRILLIPVIAGLAYEILKLSDKYKDSRIMKGFVAPGVWLQRLTTKEPTQDMVEVALEAVNEVKRLEDDLEKATPKPS